MSNVIAAPGQSLLDLAIEHLGSAEAVFSLAALNGLSITHRLAGGTSIALPPPTDKQVIRDFARRSQKPAANLDDGSGDGIGYWTIGSDFIVQ